MRVSALLLVVFGLPAQAATLSFDWVGGPVTYDTVEWVVGYPDEPTGSHSASFVFELPDRDDAEFGYRAEYDGGIGTIASNPMNAELLSKPRLGHTQGYVDGYYEVGLSAGVVDVRLDIFDGGDHFTYFSSGGIYVDHNQGDIFESSEGYWVAVLDGVLIGSSQPGFVPPTTDVTPAAVPLPATLPLLLAGAGVLFGMRRRTAARGGVDIE